MIDLLIYNPVTAFYVCWVCYVMTIVAKKLRNEKKLTPILWLFFSPFLLGVAVLDVGLQITAAWLLGVPREWTLSKRFERYRTSGTANRWQLFVANNVCGSLLNPFEDEHC
jgi:hypothetical protein